MPPYRPDFNPIENAFAKLKALLRKAAERTKDALWAAIGRLVDQITPAECVNMFAAASYDAIREKSAIGDDALGLYARGFTPARQSLRSD